MARAIWRHSFERDRDFIVFRRPLKICGQQFAAGEPFDKTLVPTRKLRQLFDAHRIVFADVDKPGSLPAERQPKHAPETLIGSNVLASNYEIAGAIVQLGDIVAAAHELSGMTVEEWNSLDQEDREDLLRLQLDRLLGQVPGDDVAEEDETQPITQEQTAIGDGMKTPITVPADDVLREVPAADSEGEKDNSGAPDIARLRADYTELTGKRPYMGWKADELQKRIDEALAS